MQTNSLNELLVNLKLRDKKDLYYFKEKHRWRNKFPFTVTNTINIIKPNAFFCTKDQLFILFFENTDSEREKNIHKQVWNFNNAPVVFVIKQDQIYIYNGFVFNKEISKLEILENEANLDNFSFWNINSEKIWKIYQKKFRNDTRVDYYLLENIRVAIECLIDKGLDRKTANNLIGRLIFSRYLIDRDVQISDKYIKNGESDERKKNLLELIQNKTKLYNYFRYIRQKFKGNLFPIEHNEITSINDTHLAILHKLFNGEELKSGQKCLFDIYNFAIIPVELISNIYELFIGEEKQKKIKAFYTPQFLVNYIISKDVIPFLKRNKFVSCKVLDPSCGSGIFLVEILRQIIEKSKGKRRSIPDNTLKNLLKNNIFGIDKDENAINIAIFSLYITLLDYKEPKDIKNFVFPDLKNRNFFAKDFFDKRIEEIFKNINIDFIIGNPPWGAIKGSHIDYCNKNSIPISDVQISQAFLIRAKDFSSKNTKCSFIVTSKNLYNHQAHKFRKYFLDNFYLFEVLEMSAIRREIFNNAIGPPAIISYRYSFNKNTHKNNMRYISLKPNLFFKIFNMITIEKYDLKIITQSYFLAYDWLWKILLYGQIIDFKFIKSLLNKNNQRLNDLIKNKNMSFGTGCIIGGDKNSAKLIKYDFLQQDNFYRFYIDKKNLIRGKDFFSNKKLHRFGTIESYKAPHLLIKRGISSQGPCVAYSEHVFAFLNSIYGLSAKRPDKNLLKNIGGLLASKFIFYYLFLTSSQWGKERDEIYKKEYLQIPIPKDFEKQNIYKYFDKISKLMSNKHNNILNNAYDSKIKKNLKNLNSNVTKLYQISEIEKDLIDYTIEVSIPLFQHKDDPYKKTDVKQLIKYANLYLTHFSKYFYNKNEFFAVEVYPNEYFIAMNFKILTKKPKVSIKFIEDKEVEHTINILSNIAIEEIAKDLYLYKDIKGFEKRSFYIIKPNEFKNWHSAIARIDISEFMNAIINSWKKIETK